LKDTEGANLLTGLPQFWVCWLAL